jgi:hypothetical protein
MAMTDTFHDLFIRRLGELPMRLMHTAIIELHVQGKHALADELNVLRQRWGRAVSRAARQQPLLGGRPSEYARRHARPSKTDWHTVVETMRQEHGARQAVTTARLEVNRAQCKLLVANIRSEVRRG